MSSFKSFVKNLDTASIARLAISAVSAGVSIAMLGKAVFDTAFPMGGTHVVKMLNHADILDTNDMAELGRRIDIHDAKSFLAQAASDASKMKDLSK